MSATTVGLGLIARDEEQTLPRLLASCEGAFDEVVLVDTGSTDRTVELFEGWAATQPQTRCKVVHFAWIDDFAAARQVALEALDCDWAAWADCDGELRGADKLRATADHVPAYMAGLMARYDYSPSVCLWVVRLVRRGLGQWKGAVHEVLTVPGEVPAIAGEIVRWVHFPLRDDGPKARWTRDLAILEREVAATPEDPRAVFYLAQTHRDLGNREQAVELYERRAAMEGWDEETFYAHYQAGALLVDVDWPRAMAKLVEAWELRPTRMEPVQALSANLRIRGCYEAAHLFALRGVGRTVPRDALYLATWVYDWGMLFELSITSYWVGEFVAAREICDRLLSRDDLPELHRRQTEHNRGVCIEAIARRAVDEAVAREAGPAVGQ